MGIMDAGRAKKFCGCGGSFLALRHIWRHIIYVSNNRTGGGGTTIAAAAAYDDDGGNDEAIHLG